MKTQKSHTVPISSTSRKFKNRLVQNAGIIRQNDETAKNLLQNHLKYDIMIMERGSGTDSASTPKKTNKER